MRDFTDLLIVIKKAAIEAVNASKPTAIVYGKVISASPLKINIEQKMTLTAAQLVLTRNVTDYKTQMTIGNTQTYHWAGTEENPVQVDVGHKHAIGKTSVTVHNGLIVGDEVLMIQMQGGQKYMVIDRVVKI